MRTCFVLLLFAIIAGVPAYAQEQSDTDSSRPEKPAPTNRPTIEERLKLLEKKVEKLESSRVGDMPVLKKLQVSFNPF